MDFTSNSLIREKKVFLEICDLFNGWQLISVMMDFSQGGLGGVKVQVCTVPKVNKFASLE